MSELKVNIRQPSGVHAGHGSPPGAPLGS